MISVDYDSFYEYPLEIKTVRTLVKRVVLSDDDALELYNKLAPIASDIIQRRADEKK